ncbi:MAG: hypothetical protein JWM33_1585 [Caulobacteraceae bacterium]|nr:hypothetical protein [Caulobacteraceae bacterium]
MSRPPKKSESIEIRIPYPAKTAFMEACRREGRSASEVLREMIDLHGAAPEPTGRPRALKWILAGLAAIGLASAALPSLARANPEAAFQHMDRNSDGVIDRAEFAARISSPRLSGRGWVRGLIAKQ